MLNKIFFKSASAENIAGAISRLPREDIKELREMLQHLTMRQKEELRYILNNKQFDNIIILYRESREACPSLFFHYLWYVRNSKCYGNRCIGWINYTLLWIIRDTYCRFSRNLSRSIYCRKIQVSIRLWSVIYTIKKGKVYTLCLFLFVQTFIFTI